MPHHPPPAGAATRERILDAALGCAEETGLRKLSMDAVARRAGIGRATLYTHYRGRRALMDAALQSELDVLFGEIRALAGVDETPEDLLVRLFAVAYRKLRDHRVLRAVLTLNPEWLLPYVWGESTAIDAGREFVLAMLPADLPLRAPRAEVAEHLVRAIHTLVLSPSKVFALDEPGGAEDYARRYLVPFLVDGRERQAGPPVLGR
ncbi:TetR/AcrR family transcriptional regulator [Patulibacter minatonensis]|uniref:TetR/AcrR family transcriptional regulator n=1 Tax=Patulibacter minatonensis TaxID=298163 RepID=UPI00047BE99D|nr:TetR/AcrR family transcriptional regulator [Patulibacter minatonensis]